MSLLLAIESSCDEMAMAVLKDQREFLSSVVASQIVYMQCMVELSLKLLVVNM